MAFALKGRRCYSNAAWNYFPAFIGFLNLLGLAGKEKAERESKEKYPDEFVHWNSKIAVF